MRLSLPVMQCDSGCGECCGVVICKEHEFQAVKELVAKNGIFPISQGITCPFFQGGQCQVYDARPFICRLFGHSKRLVCSKGYNTNIPEITEKRLTRQYGTPTRYLHEFLGENWFSEMTSGKE